jgi:hypothetical protein
MSLLSTIPPTSDLPPAERLKQSADSPKNVRGAGSADGLPQRRHDPVPTLLGGKPGRDRSRDLSRISLKYLLSTIPPTSDLPPAERLKLLADSPKKQLKIPLPVRSGTRGAPGKVGGNGSRLPPAWPPLSVPPGGRRGLPQELKMLRNAYICSHRTSPTCM